MGLNWISSNEIRNYFRRSYRCCWGLLHLQNSWQNQSVNEKTKLHLSGWRWYMSSSPYKQAVATKWCNSDPSKKKSLLGKGMCSFPSWDAAQTPTQQASYYWWYKILHHLRWLHACKISTIPSRNSSIKSCFWTLLNWKFKKLPLPKKTLMWITATYHQWNHPVDFIFVSQGNKSQKMINRQLITWLYSYILTGCLGSWATK